MGDVVVQSEDGTAMQVQAIRETLNELAWLPALGSKSWTYPILPGRYPLLRNDQEVACYELPAND